jgi:hypothetical protein
MIAVIIPLGALLIAILSVAALWLWWTGDPAPELASEKGSLTFADSIATPAAEIGSAPAQMYQAQPSNEVMRVVRSGDGQLQVLMNGTIYQTMADVSRDSVIHEHFMSTLRALAQFAQETNGVAIPPAL